MPDGLTPASLPAQMPLDPPTPAAAPRRPLWVVAALQALLVVGIFAAAGALCGVLWHQLWDAPEGVVAGQQWFTDESGLRGDFAGTGWYVVVASLAGLVLGTLTAWTFDRSELVTLVAVVGGSVLAAWLMLRVGYHLSPPDPDQLALTAPDGTRLDGALRVRRLPPRLAFPMGALVGLCAVYFLTTRRAPRPEDRPVQPYSD